MSLFKPQSRDYQRVTWDPIEPCRAVNPIVEKLLPGDSVSLDGAILRNSPLRNSSGFVGTVQLEGETLGCAGKKQRTRYKLIPFSPGAPIMAITMPIKAGTLMRPVFVRAKLLSWDAGDRRPVAVCMERIGYVDDIDAFAQARLVDAGLWHGGKTHRELVRGVDLGEVVGAVCAEREGDTRVCVTVDPSGSKDLDDAVGADPVQPVLFVYIADVPAILDALPSGASFVPKQSASIYLPGGVRSMLPKVISDNHGSLLAGQTRPACRFSIELDADGRVARVDMARVSVRVSRNYTYENARGSVWQRVTELANRLHSAYNWCAEAPPPDPHGVIATCMIAVNNWAGTTLVDMNKGLLRTEGDKGASYRETCHVPPGESTHAALGVPAYAHVTSPLRRLADIVNLRVLSGKSVGGEATSLVLRNEGRDMKRIESDVRLMNLLKEGHKEIDARVHKRCGPDVDGLWDYCLRIPSLGVLVQMRSSEEVELGAARKVRLVRVSGTSDWRRQVVACWAP